jgi:hypothetical protein
VIRAELGFSAFAPAASPKIIRMLARKCDKIIEKFKRIKAP